MSEPEPGGRPGEEEARGQQAAQGPRAPGADASGEPDADSAALAEQAERVRREHAQPRRPRRPAALLFEPDAPEEDGTDRFFDLESMDDPRELLDRATELALAFRAAADRATEFQALAAAQLADPRRFDRLTHQGIAERAGWTEDYARRMVEYGEDLLKNPDQPHRD